MQTNTHPLVSVVVPTHRRLPFLAKAVNSILEQSYNKIELLVVADGHDEEVKEYLESLDDGRVKYLTCQHYGSPAGPRNTGIATAKGYFVAFCDDDDWWEKTKLEKQVKAFEANPQAALFYTDCLYVTREGEPIQRGSLVGKPYAGMVLDKLLQRNFIPLSSVLFRREILEEFVGFSEDFTILEDYDLFLRIAERYPVGYVEEILMFYRMHAGADSRNFRKKFEEEQMLSNLWLRRFFPNDPNYSHTQEAIVISRLRFAVYSILRGKDYRGGLNALTQAFTAGPAALRAMLKFSMSNIVTNIPRLYVSIRSKHL